MINLTDLEKKINSELTTKIKNSEIKHDQLYIHIDSKNLIDVTLFLKTNENTKFRQLIDITAVMSINCLNFVFSLVLRNNVTSIKFLLSICI